MKIYKTYLKIKYEKIKLDLWRFKRILKKIYGKPNELEPVLAEISHMNDLGLSKWYEVVYYDAGSKTFKDGERVIKWKYCKDLF